jgi:hypothetical protein
MIKKQILPKIIWLKMNWIVKKFNSHNEKTAKINKISSNAEESNLIESHFNAKTMTNKEIINLNWAPQNSILLRNKYKNLIEKS